MSPTMPSRQLLFVLAAAAVVAAASIVSAAVSWARIVSLSLPVPTYLPALNVLLTCLLALAVPISQRLVSRFQKHAIRFLLPYLNFISTGALLTLFVLPLVFALPSATQSCAAETHWLHLFTTKNAITVRRIQSRLQCCGYNSMHDRAWPFPSRDNDARTCERTQGYYIACAGLWRQEQQFAASLSAASSFLNWFFLMLIVNCPLPQDESGGRIRLPITEPRRESLIGEEDRGGVDAAVVVENTTGPRRSRSQRSETNNGTETFAQTRPDDTEAGLRG